MKVHFLDKAVCQALALLTEARVEDLEPDVARRKFPESDPPPV